MFLTLEGIVSYIFIHTFIFRNTCNIKVRVDNLWKLRIYFYFYIYSTYQRCEIEKMHSKYLFMGSKRTFDTSILPYKMHYQETICLQFARIYIFLIAKEKTSRTYKRSSTSKEPHIGHYSLLIRVSRRKATLVARCMVNAIT